MYLTHINMCIRLLKLKLVHVYRDGSCDKSRKYDSIISKTVGSSNQCVTVSQSITEEWLTNLMGG